MARSAFDKWNDPRLGDVIPEGNSGEYRVYTMRGWVYGLDEMEKREEVEAVLEYVDKHKYTIEE